MKISVVLSSKVCNLRKRLNISLTVANTLPWQSLIVNMKPNITFSCFWEKIWEALFPWFTTGNKLLSLFFRICCEIHFPSESYFQSSFNSFAAVFTSWTTKIFRYRMEIYYLSGIATHRSLLNIHASASRWFYYKTLLWNFKYYRLQIKKVSYWLTSNQSMSNHVSLCQDMRFLLALP